MAGYRELFDASISDPAAFSADAARAVTWTREPKQILDEPNPPFYRWFPDVRKVRPIVRRRAQRRPRYRRQDTSCSTMLGSNE